MSTDSLELPQYLQPPMANGEVVFEAPWQSRVFGMAVSLCEQGLYTWPEFQANLIQAIGEWDRNALEAEETYRYFDHFSDALIATLEAKGVLGGQDVDLLAAEFKNRPHGHDHHH